VNSRWHSTRRDSGRNREGAGQERDPRRESGRVSRHKTGAQRIHPHHHDLAIPTPVANGRAAVCRRGSGGSVSRFRIRISGRPFTRCRDTRRAGRRRGDAAVSAAQCLRTRSDEGADWFAATRGGSRPRRPGR
jgi:hypothetical protein